MKKIICFIMSIMLINNCLGMPGQSSGQGQYAGKVASGIAALAAIGAGLYCYIQYNKTRKCNTNKYLPGASLLATSSSSQAMDSPAVAPYQSASSVQGPAGVLQERASDRPAVAPYAPAGSESVSSETPDFCRNASETTIGHLFPEASVFGADEIATDGLLSHRTRYIKAIDQQTEDKPTNKCGYMALFNAWGIQKLIEGEQGLTELNIKRKAEEKSSEIFDRKTEIAELLQIAQASSIKNLYFVFAADGYLFIENQTPDVQNNELLERFKNKEVKVGEYLHFIGFTRGHWVLASVIKVDCGVPLILYMNSLNSPLTHESEGYLLLQALWKELGL